MGLIMFLIHTHDQTKKKIPGGMTEPNAKERELQSNYSRNSNMQCTFYNIPKGIYNISKDPSNVEIVRAKK